MRTTYDQARSTQFRGGGSSVLSMQNACKLYILTTITKTAANGKHIRGVENLLQAGLEVHLGVWHERRPRPQLPADVKDREEPHREIVRDEGVRPPMALQEHRPSAELRVYRQGNGRR